VSQEQTYERGAKVTVFHLRLNTHWGCETGDNPNLCCSAGIDSMVLDVEPSIMVGACCCCCCCCWLVPACLPLEPARSLLCLAERHQARAPPPRELALSWAAAAAGHARDL
jgi:hypothetical protein